MKTSIAVLGDGGKMGFRITRTLVDANYNVRAAEMQFAKSVVIKDTWRGALSLAKVKEASKLTVNT